MKKYVTLGEVCTKGSSNIAQKDIEQNNGSYGIYGASGYIKDVDFYHQDKPYIAVVKDGAGIGRTMLLPEKTSVIGTMQYLIPKDDVCVEYLYYAVTYMNLAKYFSGATIPHIYFKDYQKEKLPLLTIEKQRKIADNLRKIDRLIELCSGILQKLDVLVKSRFVEMFGDGKYPIVKTSDICDFITKGTTPPANEIYQEYSEDRIPFLKVYNLSFTGDLLFKQEPQYISKSTHEGKLSRSKVFPNDVLMNIVGPPLGKFSVVTNEYPEWNINQAIAIFRAKEKVIPQYLMSALMQPGVLRPFLEQAVGIRQQNLSLEQCRNLEIPLPPLDLQQQFAAFVEQTDKSKLAVKQVLEKAETLKKALMQEYFG